MQFRNEYGCLAFHLPFWSFIHLPDLRLTPSLAIKRGIALSINRSALSCHVVFTLSYLSSLSACIFPCVSLSTDHPAFSPPSSISSQHRSHSLRTQLPNLPILSYYFRLPACICIIVLFLTAAPSMMQLLPMSFHPLHSSVRHFSSCPICLSLCPSASHQFIVSIQSDTAAAGQGSWIKLSSREQFSLNGTFTANLSGAAVLVRLLEHS